LIRPAPSGPELSATAPAPVASPLACAAAARGEAEAKEPRAEERKRGGLWHREKGKVVELEGELARGRHHPVKRLG